MDRLRAWWQWRKRRPRFSNASEGDYQSFQYRYAIWRDNRPW